MIKIDKIFIIIISVSFTFAMVYGGFLPFIIFYTLLSIGLIDYVYIWIIKRAIYVKVILNQVYYSAGDSVECTTQINCDTILTIPYVEVKSEVFLNSSNFIGELTTITMDENKWIHSEVHFISRGVYNFGNVYLKVSDLFHMISFEMQQDTDIKIKVYPKIHEIDKVYGGGKDIYLDTLNKSSINEDIFTIKDVRKYRTGDSLKKVHWRISAKYNELYVKNQDTISGEEIVLFIDMGKENYGYDSSGIIEETIIDIAMSIADYMRIKDIKITVYFNALSSTSFQVSCKDEMNSLMEFMVNTKSDGVLSMEEFIHQYCYKIHKMNKVIVVIGKLQDSFVNNIMALKSQGYNISVIYCIKDNETKGHEEVLKRWGIDVMNSSSLVFN